MFSFFRKKQSEVKGHNVIWMHKGMKFSALFEKSRQNHAIRRVTFLIGFFQESLDDMSLVLKTGNQPFVVLNDKHEFDKEKSFIYVVSPETFQRIFPEIKTSAGISLRTWEFVFLEHHPKASREKQILSLLEGIDLDAEVLFFSSLDEPVFELFGSGKIRTMLERMGIKENESLSHSFIDKSIVNAQKQIEKKITGDSAANSQKEWFERNK